MTATTQRGEPAATETGIPARLDSVAVVALALKILVGLGTVWILNGLEVTIVGSIADGISAKGSGLHIASADIAGLAAPTYLAGRVASRAHPGASPRQTRGSRACSRPDGSG